MKRNRYVVVLIFFGVCLSILGIALIIAGSLSFKTCENKSSKNTSKGHDNAGETINERCNSSYEADRLQLYETLDYVMHVYYLLYPNKIIWHPYSSGDHLKQFRPYNCSPAALKYRTDTVAQLYEHIKDLRNHINDSELKPRELKSLIQLLHFVKSDFGKPYGENYYTGR